MAPAGLTCHCHHTTMTANADLPLPSHRGDDKPAKRSRRLPAVSTAVTPCRNSCSKPRALIRINTPHRLSESNPYSLSHEPRVKKRGGHQLGTGYQLSRPLYCMIRPSSKSCMFGLEKGERSKRRTTSSTEMMGIRVRFSQHLGPPGSGIISLTVQQLGSHACC